MDSLRIWVSYAVADDSPQETMLAQQLIKDLQKAGAGVVTGTTLPNERFQSVLQRELPTCQWFLLVQTRQAMRSDRIQLAMNMALMQAKHGRLRGVRRVVCVSSDVWNEPAQWSEAMSYPYQGDYPRLRDKVLLDFGLLGLDGSLAGSDEEEKDPANIATRWLAPDQEARVAQEYPVSAPVSQGGYAAKGPVSQEQERPTRGPVSLEYPVNSSVSQGSQAKGPISWGVPVASFLPQGYPIQDNGTPAPRQRKDKMSKPRASLSLSPLFARLQARMPVFISGQKKIVGDRPVPIQRPFLLSLRFWLSVIGVILIVLVVLFVPMQLSSLKVTPHTGTPPTGAKGVTPPAAPVNNMLAVDTFRRANQTLWGIASDGQAWGGDANTSPAFSIADGTGQIANTQGTFSALAGPVVANADAEATVMVNQFAAGNNALNTVNMGVVLRWQDANDWYKALIDGQNFSIDRFVNGNGTIIDTTAFPAQGGAIYTIRFEAIGTTLQAKVWPSNEAEPPNWMLVMTDATFVQGKAGVRVVMQNTTQINVFVFKETAL